MPESLVRSASLLLGPEAAQLVKDQLRTGERRVPSDPTISRTRLKLDVPRLPIGFLFKNKKIHHDMLLKRPKSIIGHRITGVFTGSRTFIYFTWNVMEMEIMNYEYNIF